MGAVHRFPAEESRTGWDASGADGLAGDVDILPALAVVWVASALRVAGAMWMRETFGVEATLALATCLVITGTVVGPWMTRRRSVLAIEQRPRA